MIVITNSQFITRGGKSVFHGSAGVAPYVYSVEAGGVGGSIDANGVYTAPYAYGTDTIKVVDSLLDEAFLPVYSLTHIQLVANVIQTSMSLATDRVWIFDQKIMAPKDDNLFINLRELSCKVFSNNMRVIDGIPNQTTNFQAQYSIDIESHSLEALQRKEEVIMALRGQYAQNQQTLNGFKIAGVATSFVNLSELEGSAIPYRYNITMNVLYAKIFVDQAASYYDEFDISIDTNSGDHEEIDTRNL